MERWQNLVVRTKTTGARICHYINATVSMKLDPLKSRLTTAGVTRYVTEAILRRLNISPLPLASLTRTIKNTLTPRGKSAAEKGSDA